jgi:hypothetical protein
MRKKLLNGEVISMSNEEYQTSIGRDDIRTAELLYKKCLDSNMYFMIRFDGIYIHMSKTFKPFEKRLKQLVEKWNLKEIKEIN